MIQVNSLSDFQLQIQNLERSYLLLSNSDNDKGKCAIKSVTDAQLKVNGINVFYADVSQVRDIHPVYNITSAPSLLEFEGASLKNVIKGCNSERYYKAIFEDAVYYAETKNDKTPQKQVTVYSTPTCSWCNTLKSYLKQHRIRFTDIDVSADQKAADELVKRSGQMGVPQTDINGEIIVGFNKARINELLGIQG
jgi:glutaredoxin-like YruB-family protein